MLVEQVDVVGAKTTQGAFHCMANVVWTPAAAKAYPDACFIKFLRFITSCFYLYAKVVGNGQNVRNDNPEVCTSFTESRLYRYKLVGAIFGSSDISRDTAVV